MKYFTIHELCKSPTADKYGINNQCPAEQEKNLKALVEYLLDPLREKWGKHIYVNSGYRCPELNRMVGGVDTSQHVKGEAADLRTDDARKFFNFVRSSGLSFDQIILYPTFVHLSYRSKGANRNQVLYAKGVQP